MNAVTVQSFVHRHVPAEGGGQSPALLLLHGTGGDENDLLPLGRLIAPGAAVISPRGKVLENGKPRFFRRLAEGVFDLADLRARTEELADWIAAAREGYGLVNGVVAVGFSNGANIAASLLLARPKVLRGAILLRPMVPFTPETAPDLAGTPVFIGAGVHDPIVVPEQSERLAQMLRDAGADVTLHWEPAGHSIGPTELKVVPDWCSRHFLDDRGDR